jgi:hypothetical protein
VNPSDYSRKILLIASPREFIDEFVQIAISNEANGLRADRNVPELPANVAAIGLALSSYPIGVERTSVWEAAAARPLGLFALAQ